MNKNRPSVPEWRKLLKLSLPVILSQVGAMLMGLVDSFVVGRHSSLELAGVAAGNSVFVTVFIISLGLQFGMDGIVAQAYGARDLAKGKRCLFVSLKQCLVFSTLGLLFLLAIAQYFHLTGAVPEVVQTARPFLWTLSFALPVLSVSSALQRYWQGHELVLPFTLVILLANGLNYLLDIALVTGRWGFPALGARGAAYSTLICHCVILAAVLAITAREWKRRKLSQNPWRELLGFWRVTDPLIHKRLLQVAWPAMGQVAFEVGAFSFVTLMAARLGASVVATHQVILNIASFAFMFPAGLAAATATRVGYHVGGKRPDQAVLSGWLGIGGSVAIMSLSSLLLYLYPEALLGIFTKDPQLIRLGVSIIFLCVCFQIFDGIQVVAAGALRGLGNTRVALLSNLVSHWFLGIPTGLYLCFIQNLGIWGLWAGLSVGLLATACLNSFAWWRMQNNLEPKAVV